VRHSLRLRWCNNRRRTDPVNARAGEQSRPEAKSFCSPPQSFRRADAKQERRSKVQLPALNQDEWQCSRCNRTGRRQDPLWRIGKLSLNRAGSGEVSVRRSRWSHRIHRGRGVRAASYPIVSHPPSERCYKTGSAHRQDTTRSSPGCYRIASPPALLQHIDQPTQAEGIPGPVGSSPDQG
jgi:hypothetical protein